MYRRFYIFFIQLTISLLFLSCEQDEVNMPEVSNLGISFVQAYSADQKTLVKWHTYSGYDFNSRSQLPSVISTKLLMATYGEDNGFELVHTGEVEGNDSVWVTGLLNGVSYYFKLETYDFNGQKIGTSIPIQTIPGLIPEEVFSYKFNQSNGGNNVTNLAWSPNGREIAFIDADSSGYKNIHILDLYTYSIRVVTNHKSEAMSDISWSPDGKYLAYIQSPSITASSINYRIWLLNLTTLDTYPVSSGPVDFDPDWLSDTTLVFVKGTKGAPNIPELNLLNLSNGSESPITHEGKMYKYAPNVYRPTGQIVYWANNDLYVTSINSGVGNILINNDFGEISNPSWSFNGESVFFTADYSGQKEIWSVKTKEKEISLVTRSRNIGSFRDIAKINDSGTLLAYIESEADNSTFLKIVTFN